MQRVIAAVTRQAHRPLRLPNSRRISHIIDCTLQLPTKGASCIRRASRLGRDTPLHRNLPNAARLLAARRTSDTEITYL